MTKKAHIHHKDGNPTNNPPNGSNWEVLCPECHQKIPKNRKGRDGIFFTASFAPWKRAEIIKSRNNRCEQCGTELTTQRLSNKPRLRCKTCDKIIERNSDLVTWKDGSISCVECFNRDYQEV